MELRLSAYCYAKIRHLIRYAKTEVGFLGLSHAESPLSVIDLHMPKQENSAAFVELDDEDMADYINDMALNHDTPPNRTSRIWFHTHPGNSPRPSGTDENTFRDQFGLCDWAVMAIMAKDNSWYARLAYSTALGRLTSELQVVVDYDLPSPAFDPDTWEAECDRVSSPKVYPQSNQRGFSSTRYTPSTSGRAGTTTTGTHTKNTWNSASLRGWTPSQKPGGNDRCFREYLLGKYLLEIRSRLINGKYLFEELDEPPYSLFLQKYSGQLAKSPLDWSDWNSWKSAYDLLDEGCDEIQASSVIHPTWLPDLILECTCGITTQKASDWSNSLQGDAREPRVPRVKVHL